MKVRVLAWLSICEYKLFGEISFITKGTLGLSGEIHKRLKA